MQKALDISKHQDTFSPATAKAEGVSSVILRAAYGNFMDVRFDRFAADCRSAGMPFGAYIFLTHHYANKNAGSVDTARTIMNKHLDVLLEILNGKGITSWVALDQELEAGQTMTLTPAENTALLNEAAARLRQAGYTPCVYCSASWAQSRIDTAALTCPVWVAFYYADPNDPDFDGCKSIEDVSSKYAAFMRGLGDKLCGWQFGRIGYGGKYGVGSTNVDRDWIYFQPNEKEDDPMDFEPITGKQLRCTSAENPKCETFSDADINASLGALELDRVCQITAKGDTIKLAGMIGTWYKIIDKGAEVYCLDLPDGRCVVEDAPSAPSVDMTEVLSALERIESAQAANTDQLSDIKNGISTILEKLSAAGAALK